MGGGGFVTGGEGLQCSGGERGYRIVEGRELQGSGGEGGYRVVEGRGVTK